MSCRCIHQNELYETTTISGFRFVNLSKSKFEIIFWYIIIICFASITIISLHGSVQNYLSSPTVTSVVIASAENDEMRNSYIFLSVPFFEFSNATHFDNEFDLFHNMFLMGIKVLAAQYYLFHNVSAETILKYWFLIKDNHYDISKFRNTTCIEDRWKDTNDTLLEDFTWDTMNKMHYLKEKYLPYISEGGFDFPKECITNKSGMEENIRELHQIIGYTPSNEDIFLNILLRLYTLQDTFDKECDMLKNETSLMEFYIFFGQESKIHNARDYYIDYLMGGPIAGEKLVEAAKIMNKTMANILETCNTYFQFLYNLHFCSHPVEFAVETMCVDLVLQGIKLLPDMMPRLEFKFFPNITENFNETKGSSFKTTISVQPRHISKMTADLRNDEYMTFKKLYTSVGYSMYIKDPDFVDKLDDTSRMWWELPAELVVKPYTNTAINYVLAAKHIQQYNNSCNKSKQPNRCFADCKSRIFVKYCNCVPWGLTTEYQSNRLCEDAASCLKNKIGNKLDQCNDVCSFCETIIWRSDIVLPSSHDVLSGFISPKQVEWDAIYPMPSGQHNPPTAHLSWTYIKRNKIYPMFQENYKYNTGTFLAELGGQMDLWIGCSVIGILHILIFICKVIYRRVQQWKKNFKDTNEIQLAEIGASQIQAPTVLVKSSVTNERLDNAEIHIRQIIKSEIKKLQKDHSYPDILIGPTRSNGRNQTYDANKDMKNTGYKGIKFHSHYRKNGIEKRLTLSEMSNDKRDRQISEIQNDLIEMRNDLKSMSKMLHEMKN